MTIEELYGEFLASSGICTDTREAVKDSLFVALKGEHFDGNRFVPAALEGGCHLAVTGREDLSGDPRVLVVTSPLETLQQLAHYHRMQVAPRVLAITGSNGKTTTKELVTRVLSVKYKVLATRGNLNNHIGVPLTLLSLKGEEVAVVEMGANHPGEITALCRIAAPEAGLITNVGKAHLEGFGSLEGVLRAKGELYGYLAGTGGIAIIDGRDPMLMKKAGEAVVKSLVVGPEGDLQVQCTIIRQTPCLEVELHAGGEVHPVPTRLVGAYNLQNILLAAGTGLHFGVPPSGIAEAIRGYVPDNNRSQLVEGKRNRLILDSYNANPTSMREAIGDLVNFARPPIMLILGEMAELGTSSGEEHRELLEWIGTLQVDRVLLLGNKFSDLYRKPPNEDQSKPRIRVFSDRDELQAYLQSDRPEGYHILVKGSRVNELEKIVPLL
jgi:UDP-N-acetylmuramoyl-tripeptide--D-alanyl-D-alanine ligase